MLRKLKKKLNLNINMKKLFYKILCKAFGITLCQCKKNCRDK